MTNTHSRNRDYYEKDLHTPGLTLYHANSHDWSGAPGMEQRGFQKKIDEESGAKRLQEHLAFKVLVLSDPNSILNRFIMRTLRSQTPGNDGNGFLSFFLPDEFKRSDWR